MSSNEDYLSGTYLLGHLHQGEARFYLDGDYAKGQMVLRAHRWEEMGRPVRLAISVVQP